MNRSGYSDDCEFLDLYRANVDRAIAGKRGQAFLRELAAVMDAMPAKRLIRGGLIDETGGVCAFGAVCQARGVKINSLYDAEDIARVLGLAYPLAAEIMWVNDWRLETLEQRWTRVRKWVADNCHEETKLEKV